MRQVTQPQASATDFAGDRSPVSNQGLSYEGGRCDRLEVLLEAGSQIGNEAERREFLNRYCRPWLDDFAEQLASRASLPFYPGLLGAIGELLESELAEEEE